MGLDQLIDAAEGKSGAEQENDKNLGTASTIKQGVPTGRSKKRLLAMTGTSRSSQRPADWNGPTADTELGLDKIDVIGVDGVLQESSEELARNMQNEPRETCSALATSLLQALGPFNYVS